ncbi:MAG: methyltransferase, partial [Treponema sp.]|nr:methyltransferase [Treponema sp.]
EPHDAQRRRLDRPGGNARNGICGGGRKRACRKNAGSRNTGARNGSTPGSNPGEPPRLAGCLRADGHRHSGIQHDRVCLCLRKCPGLPEEIHGLPHDAPAGRPVPHRAGGPERHPHPPAERHRSYPHRQEPGDHLPADDPDDRKARRPCRHFPPAGSRFRHTGRNRQVYALGSGVPFLSAAAEYPLSHDICKRQRLLRLLQESPHYPARVACHDTFRQLFQTRAGESGYDRLRFMVGNIADYADARRPDLVVTLHACDTATDYALDWAIRQGAAAILSVPCCQHELNTRLQAGAPVPDASPFAPLTRYGLIRERFAALVTDTVRAELLEQAGYRVQVLEFVDMSHTPKNVLLRAVKKRDADVRSADGQKTIARSREREKALLSALELEQELDRLRNGTAPGSSPGL